MVSKSNSKFTFILLAAALVAGIAVQAYLSGDASPTGTESSGANAITWVNASDPIPPFELARSDGGKFTNADFQDRWTILFFGFANCPDICPMTLATMARVTERLEAAGKSRPQVVFVSIDPDRDTPQLAQKYAQSFDPAFVAATAPVEQLRKLTDPLGVIFMQVAQGNSYTMDHSTALILVGPDATLAGILGAPHQQEALFGELSDVLP